MAISPLSSKSSIFNKETKDFYRLLAMKLLDYCNL